MVEPKPGDIIIVELDPTKESEQAGTRPVLVVSQDLHNKKQKMIFACPITDSERNYPTHTPIDGRCNNITGFVMCEQLKALYYEKRGVKLIDRAGDDAVGLTGSTRMRSQIIGLNQAVKNAQEGIALIQTAEGALEETRTLMQRMRELAVQAASDTRTAQDRAAGQDEIGQLTAEIDRIAHTTAAFNQKTCWTALPPL